MIIRKPIREIIKLRSVYYIFLAIFSSLSITGIKNYSIISPNNLLIIILFLLYIGLNKKIIFRKNIFFIYTLFSSMLFQSKSSLNLGLSIFILNFDKNIKKIKEGILISVVKLHIYIFNFYLATELLLRFGGIKGFIEILKKFIFRESNFNFYLYKVNTFMYSDTNYIGIILGLYMINLWNYSNFTNKKNWFLKISSFVYLIGTLSRAAYISVIFVCVYLYFDRYNIAKNIKKIFFLIIFIFLTIIIYFLSKNDGSFLSKFKIINNTIAYYKTVNIFNLFFGVGYGNSRHYLGIYAHNIFLVNLIEGGVIGFILFIGFLKKLLKDYSNLKYIIFYYILVSSSASMYNYSYFIFTILISNELYRRKNK